MAEEPQRVDGSMNRMRIFMYPCYIDKNVSTFKGRKLPLEHCVDNPWVEELSKAVFDLGFQGIYSVQKRHPRNFWKFGRLSITFFKIDQATGERVPIYPQYPKRKDMFKAIADRIKYNREHMPAQELRKLKNPKNGKGGRR